MKKVIALAALTVLVGVAQAQIFNSEAAFQAAIANDPGQYLNTFTGATSVATVFGSGGSPTMTYAITTDSGGVYGSGSFIGGNLTTDAVTIRFTSGNVRAVGGNFFNTDLGDNFLSGRTVVLAYSDGTLDTYAPDSASDFRGYVSSTILTSVVMFGLPGAYASLDNLVTSTRAVPEPASLAALALGAVIIVRRRKNS